MALVDYKNDMKTCHRCSVCKFIPLERVTGYDYVNVCPSISRFNFHAYSGGGKLSLGTALLEKKIDYSPKLLEVLYNCQLCGGCDVSCKYAMDMEILEPINEMRIDCVSQGYTLPVLDKRISGLKSNGNLFHAAPEKRMEWAENLKLKDVEKEKADIIYYAGCRTCYFKSQKNVANVNIALLQKAGIDFGVMYNESCCGVRAYHMGYKDEAVNQAKLNMELIQKSGCKTLVTGCAECYHAFKVLYDKFGVKGDLVVRHTSEYFAELVGKGALKPEKPVDMTVTYHDPCYLGRQGEDYRPHDGKLVPGHVILYDPPKEYRRGYNGVYEPSRLLMAKIPGLKLLEMERIKEYAWCCGAGGGVQETNPAFAQWTAKERIQEAAKTGAEAIVTGCPGCETLFNNTILASQEEMKVFDLSEILAQAIL